jgi:hypothetical protein
VVAPEFQTLNAASGLSRLNFVYKAVNNQLSGNVKVDLSNLYDLSADPDALVEALNQALYHGAMDSSLRANLAGVVNEIRQTTKDPATIVKAVTYFAAAAPQYQVEQ